jgi:hypothetical protein
MKTENEKIKEIFSKNLEPHHDRVPDFESMWRKAEQGSRKKDRLLLKIAASIALLIATGAIVILNQRGDENQANSMMQIEAWAEPTKGLMIAQSAASLTVLTDWYSPTDFLLPQNQTMP